jgi:hypothetical protein
MKKSQVLLIIIFMALVLGFSGRLRASEEPYQYTYGTVSNISAEKLVIVEYDYDQDLELEVSYLLDADTVLKNVSSLNEIPVGSNVEIDYIIKDGQRITRVITLEKKQDSNKESSQSPPNSGKNQSE